MATATDLQVKYLFATVTAEGADADAPGLTVSTINYDREGDRVIPEGGQFANYLKNPVLMWSHGYGEIPIGSVTELSVTPGKGITAKWRWLEDDPFADRVKNAWAQGIVRSSSLGFRPLSMQPNGRGLDIESWELLELSLCAIPMNPEAVRMLKGLLDADGKKVDVALTQDELDAVLHATSVDGAPVNLKTLTAVADVLQKRGRVLSAVNESRLRAAVNSMSDAMRVVGDILSLLEMPMEPEHEDDDEKMPTPAEEHEDHHGTPDMHMAADDIVLRLVIDEDSGDDVLFRMVNDEPDFEPVYRIDRDDLKAAVADVVGAHLRDVRVQIGDVVQAVIDKARGRVS